MRTAGFTLSRLRLIGPGKCPAELTFAPGLNVIAGASNTGKSYIVQCLNYMMGAQRPPKPVPEGKGYTSALLELRSAEGKSAVLERSLEKGGQFRCYLTTLDLWHERLPSSRLAWKHNPRSEANVSRLLLALCELEGVMVRMNAAGKVRPLSFRDLCRFLLVDETRILSDWSPVHSSGQLPKKTEDASVFDFMISGEDAQRVVEQADVKLQKARWRAKVELYDRLIADLEAELKESGAHLLEPHALVERLAAVDTAIDQLLVRLEGLREESFVANKAELSRRLEERRVLLAAQATRARLDDLVAGKSALGAEPKRRVRTARPEVSPVEEEARRAFCQQVDQILTRWNFPHAPGVELGEDRDLVTGGIARHTQGKGYRAILHAAFSLALMRRSGPRHPGFLILDSPLTSYKEKDGYEVEEDIQQAFFADLAAAEDEQILVFENKDPSKALQSRIHFLHLSGRAGAGRAGFFPS